MRVVLFAVAVSFVVGVADCAEPVPVGEDGLIHLKAKPEMLGIVPTFNVQSLARSVDFYRTKLGFAVVLQSGNYVAVGREAVQIGLVADRNVTKGYKLSCYIRMAQIDDYYKELETKGVKMTSPLKLEPSKNKVFSLTDPDGYNLVFGEYVGGT